MDRESIYELQKIDCNCNNCHHFHRDIEKTKRLNTNPSIKQNKIHYGRCDKFNKAIGEIANICLLHTRECFLHRKDKRPLHKENGLIDSISVLELTNEYFSKENKKLK